MRPAIFTLLLYSFFIIGSPSLLGQSQDSTKLNIKFNMGLGAVTTEYPFSNDIQIDPAINTRRRSLPLKKYYLGKLTDQPHEHGSIFTHFSTKTTFKKDYVFYANLLMEYRGESYGANDLNNAVVFPFLYGQLKDTIRIKRRPVELFLHIGDLFQYRLNQGLQVYNVDIQAMIVRMKYEDWQFQIVHLPDHSRGIGVALEELFSFNLSRFFEDHKINFAFELNSNSPYQDPLSSTLLPNQYYTHLSLDYEYQLEDIGKFYAQIGARKFDTNFNQEAIAFLVGADLELQKEDLSIQLRPELRYYAKNYNLGYYNPTALFRDNSISTHYGNTVGRYLYPLKNYDYPYSQWAVFTEYQNQNVLGYGLNVELDKKLWNNFGVRFLADFLGIRADESNHQTFLYTWNIYYEPTDDLYIRTMVTNKVMNLDAHFQTFYQLKHPALGLELRKTLEGIW